MAVFPIANSLVNCSKYTHRAMPKRNIIRHYPTKEAVKNVTGGIKQKVGEFFRKAINNFVEYVDTVGKNYRMK